jgi:hypothetical protein
MGFLRQYRENGFLRAVRWFLFPTPREVAAETRRIASYAKVGFGDVRKIFFEPLERPSLALRLRDLPVAVTDMPCHFCEHDIIAGEQYLSARRGRVICCVPCSLGH